jgi:hypothetical protein
MSLSVLSQHESDDNSDNLEESDNNDSTIDQLATMFANQDINNDKAEINPIYSKRYC